VSDTTTPSTLQDVVQVAGAVAPVAGDVGEVAKLADDVVELLTPPIEQAEIDKPTNELKARLAQYETIFDNPNEATRATQLGDFINRLCLDAEIPVGIISGTTVSVPVEYLDALVSAAGQLIKEREQATAALISPAKPVK